MGSKKGGGKARTPVVHKNTLFSKQLVKFMDVISEGEIAGFANGDAHPFKSVYFNDTPVQNADGSFNFNGVEAFYNVGEPDQSYLPGFEATEKTVQVGVEVKRDAPVTRTVTDPLVSSIRATVGVKSLMEAKDNGDRVKTRVDLQVAIIKEGVIHDSQLISIYEKGTAGYYQDATFTDLPEAPFNIEVRRLTPDSDNENLQNDTNFASYVEIIDAKLSLPNLATAGYKIDSSMFGQSLPRINHLIKGIVCLIPTNYDPINRTYSGVWDGSFKRGWTDNPAWILYTLATNNRYGAGINPRYIDIASLYRVSRFCDEMVDDGFGGKEPRVTFNAYYTDEKKSSERRQEIASSFFGLAIWDGKYLTATIDDDTDPTALYTNHNVKDGEFAYEEVGADAVITTVHVQYHDKRDAYRQKIEVVEDIELVKRFRTNIKRVVAEGCTSRSQAQRYGRYILEKSRQKMTVSFTVGREGLRHSPWDIIQIADNHYAGAVIGGRVLEVDGNTVTLDLEVENAKGGTFTYIGEKDGRLQTIETEILSQKDERTLVLKEKTADLKRMTTWSLTRKDVKPKYYRALSIVDNKDGTYSIKAIEHEWGLHDRIAKGIRYEKEKDSIWTSYPTISNPNLGNEGGDVIISWDSINDATTALTYTVKLYRDGKIYRTYENLAEPVFRFDSLPDGDYVVEIRAKNARGQLSNKLEMRFAINYTITELTAKSEYFGISLSWKLPEIVNKSISTEIWRAEVDDIDKARRIMTLPYPTDRYLDNGLAVTDSYYYWVRVIDQSGTTGKFTPSTYGEVSTDAAGLLEMLEGQITSSELSKEVMEGITEDVMLDLSERIDDVVSESDIISEINKRIEDTEVDQKLLSLAQISSDRAITAQTQLLNAKQGLMDASLKLMTLAEITSTRATAERLALLSAQTGKLSATISELSSTTVTEVEALAKSVRELKASVGDDLSAKITEVYEVIADVEGNVKSMVTLVANANGVISGVKFGSDGKESHFNIFADKLTVVNQRNGKKTIPFMINGDKVGINGDLIVNGSILGKHIAANQTISSPVMKSGRLESGHIAGGSININGNFNVDSKGNLVAKSGRFEGTVYADKIVGDVASIMYFPARLQEVSRGREIRYVIPPENFDRIALVSIPIFQGRGVLNMSMWNIDLFLDGVKVGRARHGVPGKGQTSTGKMNQDINTSIMSSGENNEAVIEISKGKSASIVFKTYPEYEHTSGIGHLNFRAIITKRVDAK